MLGNVSSYAIRYFDCQSVKDISQFTSFFGGNEVEINLSTSFATHICVFLYGGLNHVTGLVFFSFLVLSLVA